MRDFLVAASVVLNVVLLGAFLLAKIELWDARGVSKFRGAYGQLLREALVDGCGLRENVQKAAFVRDWRVEAYLPQDDFETFEKPLRFASALRVHVQPSLPFSKMPGVLFFFDESGCLMEEVLLSVVFLES